MLLFLFAWLDIDLTIPHMKTAERYVVFIFLAMYFFYFFYSGVEWLWFLGCYSCYALLVASFTEMHFVTETRFVEFFVILPKGLCGYGCMI